MLSQLGAPRRSRLCPRSAGITPLLLEVKYVFSSGQEAALDHVQITRGIDAIELLAQLQAMSADLVFYC